MVHTLRSLVLLAVFGFLVAPGVGQEKADPAPGKDAEKDKTDKDKGEKDKTDKDKGEKMVAPVKAPPPPPNPWVKVGTISGKVQSYNESDRSVSLTIQTPVLDQGAVAALGQAQIRLAQARNIQEVVTARNDIARQQAALYKMQPQNVSAKLHDDIKVRFNTPPPTFDEKGRLQTKYTPAQLKDMKGTDLTLPGYKAEISDIANNQTVQITLVQHKDRLRPRPQPRPMAKNPDNADADLLMVEELKPQISILVIYPQLIPGN